MHSTVIYKVVFCICRTRSLYTKQVFQNLVVAIEPRTCILFILPGISFEVYSLIYCNNYLAPEKEKRKKESSISPSQKLSQRSQSPPPLSESPLSPGYTQKGAKSQKHSSPKPTTATKGSKSSPKKNRENSVVVKKEKLPSLSEYLRPANSSEMALKVTPQTTVKLESKLLPQSVVTRPSHESKELTAPLTKSNKKPKPSLGNSQPTMFSVVGPPMKVPLVEIKALPRESLSFLLKSSTKQT